MFSHHSLCHHLLWLLMALVLGVSIHNIIRILPVVASTDIPILPVPISGHHTVRISPCRDSLFNEKNAWSPIFVDEMTHEDPRLPDAPISALLFSVRGILYEDKNTKCLIILASGAAQFIVAEGDGLLDSEEAVARIFSDRVTIINRGVTD